MTGYGSSPDMTFQLVDRPPQVPFMVDMLTIAMGRLLPAMDMDMLQLPMADMLLSATDMTLIVSGSFDV